MFNTGLKNRATRSFLDGIYISRHGKSWPRPTDSIINRAELVVTDSRNRVGTKLPVSVSTSNTRRLSILLIITIGLRPKASALLPKTNFALGAPALSEHQTTG